jgi:hypothetical protein
MKLYLLYYKDKYKNYDSTQGILQFIKIKEKSRFFSDDNIRMTEKNLLDKSEQQDRTAHQIRKHFLIIFARFC